MVVFVLSVAGVRMFGSSGWNCRSKHGRLGKDLSGTGGGRAKALVCIKMSDKSTRQVRNKYSSAYGT